MWNSLEPFPFIAITRGIKPEETLDCATILFENGFRILETPLNSPRPLESIAIMAEHFGEKAIIGAGTVTKTDHIAQVKRAGGKLIISPHCDEQIIRTAKDQGLFAIPGVATPTEAIKALQAGADALKLFPSELITPTILKAIKTVLPENTLLIPVGGINTKNWQPYYQAGASAFGLGSSLYKKGISRQELEKNAAFFAESWKSYSRKRQPLPQREKP